jgi:hypothetical protein
MNLVKKIFKNKKYLLEETEVQELIEYCNKLEDTNIEYSQKLDQTIVLKQILSEIKNSTKKILEDNELAKRWPQEFENIDFEKGFDNLYKYIENYCEKNEIYL